MNLVIDIGNTQVKLCVFNKNEIIYHAYFKNLDSKIFSKLIAEFEVDKGIFSDTRGLEINLLKKMLPPQFNLLELTYKTPLPIKIDYKTPQSLGKDRIAGAVGAWEQHPNTPLLIIDIGTAITIDYVSSNGTFQGGIISPGPEMRFKALHQFTGKLPLLEPIENVELIGNTTSTSIQSGVQNGILYEIKGYIEQYRKNNNEIKIVLTGGFSYLFENKINYPIFADSLLVPKGLNSIINYSSKSF